MAKRYRLLGRAQINGEARDSGYIFTLEDGEKGPMRTVGMNGPNPRDEKLYEEVDEAALAAAEAASNPAAQPEGGAAVLTDAPKGEPTPDDGGVKTPVFVSENDPPGGGTVHVSEKDGDK